MIAYDYPLLGAFWTMFWFFIWILWIMLLFRIFGDIFRSHDLSGWAKAAWLIFVIVVPFLGVFVYLIARGNAMGERDVEQARSQQQAFNAYVQDVAATGGSADELTKLADLKDRGVISAAEFEQQKARILA
jgi:type VI protein secretion system component VasK